MTRIKTLFCKGLLLSLLFFPCLAQPQALAYIKKYDSLAIQIMKEHGIPASVVLGIGLHESGAGTSKMCRNDHNHFGVKGRHRNAKGRLVYGYSHFESDEAAYAHFARMVTSKKYYNHLKGNMDPEAWLSAMAKSGYAASPSWKQKTLAIIRKYKLREYDNEASNENQQ